MATNLNLDIAQELNITVRRGDSISFNITVQDANGDGIDVSAYKFDMDIRDGSRESRENVVMSTSASGIEGAVIPLMSVVGLADGTITVSISRSEAEGLNEGTYLYDIQATNANGSISQTWFYGVFVVNSDVSDFI